MSSHPTAAMKHASKRLRALNKERMQLLIGQLLDVDERLQTIQLQSSGQMHIPQSIPRQRSKQTVIGTDHGILVPGPTQDNDVAGCGSSINLPPLEHTFDSELPIPAMTTIKPPASVFKAAAQIVPSIEGNDALVQLMRLVAAIGQSLVIYKCAPSPTLSHLIVHLNTVVATGDTDMIDGLISHLTSFQRKLTDEADTLIRATVYAAHTTRISSHIPNTESQDTVPLTHVPALLDSVSNPRVSNATLCRNTEGKSSYEFDYSNDSDYDIALSAALNTEAIMTLSDTLNPVHFGVHLESIASQHTRHTLVHVCDRFNDWCLSTPLFPLLWLRGNVGCGKSVALAHLAEHLTNTQNPPVKIDLFSQRSLVVSKELSTTDTLSANLTTTQPLPILSNTLVDSVSDAPHTLRHILISYVCCGMDDSRTRSALALLKTISFQLAFQNSEFLHCIASSSVGNEDDDNLPKQFERLLLEPMRKLYTQNFQIFVFIDDIDLLDDSDEFILCILASSINPARSHICFVVSTQLSRHPGLYSVPDSNVIDLSSKPNISQHQQDILAYVSKELMSINVINSLPSKETKGIIEMVCQKAGSSFAQAVNTVFSLRLATKSFRVNLSSSYMNILKQAIIEDTDTIVKGYFDDMEENLTLPALSLLMHTLVYIFSPVDKAFIANLMAYYGFSEFNENVINECLGELIFMSDNGQIDPYSSSLRNYLERPISKFRITPEKAHHAISVACLQCLSTSYSNDGMEARESTITYATLHWHDHILMCSPSSDISLLIEGFLSNRGILFYLEELARMDMLLVAKSAIRALSTYTTKLSDMRLSERITTYANDIDFVLSNFADILVESPKEMLRSVLLFTPPSNYIRDSFSSEYLTAQHGVIADGLHSHIGNANAMTLMIPPKDYLLGSHKITALNPSYVLDKMGILFTGGQDGRIMSWDVKSKSHLHTFVDLTEKANSTDLDPGSDVIALASSCRKMMLLSGRTDGLTILWDISTGLFARKFIGHTGAVVNVAFCATSDVIVTSSQDNSARIWDITTGNVLQIIDRKIPSMADFPTKSLWSDLTMHRTITRSTYTATSVTVQHTMSISVNRTTGAVYISQIADDADSLDSLQRTCIPIVNLPLSLRDLTLIVALPSDDPNQICLWLFTRLGFLTIIGLPGTSIDMEHMYRTIQDAEQDEFGASFGHGNEALFSESAYSITQELLLTNSESTLQGVDAKQDIYTVEDPIPLDSVCGSKSEKDDVVKTSRGLKRNRHILLRRSAQSFETLAPHSATIPAKKVSYFKEDAEENQHVSNSNNSHMSPAITSVDNYISSMPYGISSENGNGCEDGLDTTLDLGISGDSTLFQTQSNEPLLLFSPITSINYPLQRTESAVSSVGTFNSAPDIQTLADLHQNFLCPRPEKPTAGTTSFTDPAFLINATSHKADLPPRVYFNPTDTLINFDAGPPIQDYQPTHLPMGQPSLPSQSMPLPIPQLRPHAYMVYQPVQKNHPVNGAKTHDLALHGLYLAPLTVQQSYMYAQSKLSRYAQAFPEHPMYSNSKLVSVRKVQQQEIRQARLEISEVSEDAIHDTHVKYVVDSSTSSVALTRDKKPLSRILKRSMLARLQRLQIDNKAKKTVSETDPNEKDQSGMIYSSRPLPIRQVGMSISPDSPLASVVLKPMYAPLDEVFGTLDRDALATPQSDSLTSDIATIETDAVGDGDGNASTNTTESSATSRASPLATPSTPPVSRPGRISSILSAFSDHLPWKARRVHV
ncbi:hypothetical protein BASA50_009385 [Batrachochytrium salamandrivorans]|uniref:Nephrocystin 3-like N-terminal domain-containing protein n=1 Tax=Batrachochytrium salamandrivorans TaxID=1357716 RepID=A0ABQ8F1I9_9FUNG|nr:hypothetical protein BASA50_009385 [Batrachochytrium salamandrivorans]KAH6592149.1 hypothetical protein BASA61_004689 [Batrachochytrium salamandrivorans]KAH9252492.1 hypothetical protein BASA81_009535 [Batrachochytrium salamandrivorans]KAH9273199.1 hypothetical protein BASA83_004488 [Batrachochytrium salamandrivorans]